MTARGDSAAGGGRNCAACPPLTGDELRLPEAAGLGGRWRPSLKHEMEMTMRIAGTSTAPRPALCGRPAAGKGRAWRPPPGNHVPRGRSSSRLRVRWLTACGWGMWGRAVGRLTMAGVPETLKGRMACPGRKPPEKGVPGIGNKPAGEAQVLRGPGCGGQRPAEAEQPAGRSPEAGK